MELDTETLIWRAVYAIFVYLLSLKWGLCAVRATCHSPVDYENWHALHLYSICTTSHSSAVQHTNINCSSQLRLHAYYLRHEVVSGLHSEVHRDQIPVSVSGTASAYAYLHQHLGCNVSELPAPHSSPMQSQKSSIDVY